jgi:hypothetical protein
MPLNLQMLVNNGLIDELANSFTSPTDAELLLTAISFPIAYQPKFDRADTPMDFWLAVCKEIDKGRTRSSFEDLLEASSARLPGNRIFAPFSQGDLPTIGGQNDIPAFVGEYDIFISYSRRDQPVVSDIISKLKQRGVVPWLDQWDIELGHAFIEEIEKILTNVKNIAVFFGKTGYGPWQRAEVSAVYSRVVSKTCRLIPILLPGVTTSELPLFLQPLNALQITGDKSDEESIDKLVQQILQPDKFSK